MRLIALDFDGVLHSYASGWHGAHVVSDAPVPGALNFIKELIEDKRFVVCIYSSRSHQPGGIDAMKEWLFNEGLTQEQLSQIEFPKNKPQAKLIIDDRGFQFQGKFPTLDYIDNFVPWYK